MILKTNVPENLGIPSEAVLRFLEHLEQRKICLHSFMVLRHGEIATEGYYPPFKADTIHRMYSISKTFVSVAIGFLIDEGKVKLDDKVTDFFPEYKTENIHEYIANATVRDLLMMSTPYEYSAYSEEENWVRAFFHGTASHKSGALFIYDTGGTVMLTGIAEKLTGKNLLDYLRPKLLDHIGFSKEAWCVERPEGGAWGGSGVECSTHDLAKFGLFLLNKGRCGDKQLLSEDYVNQATSAQIDNRISTGDPEFQFGYGYQIWHTRNGGFALYGMGSQLCVCVPDKDLMLVTTADTQIIPHGSDIILDAFWNDVYPYVTDKNKNDKDEKLPENKKTYEKLKNKFGNLEFISVDGKPTSHKSHELYSGKKYPLGKNRMNISEVQFIFDGDRYDKAVMKYTNATGNHEIQFGICRYETGEFPETHYFGRKIGVPKGCGYRYKASGAWFDDETLIIYLYIIDDYFGTLKINVRFSGDGKGITLFMSKSAEWFLDEYYGIAETDYSNLI
ncbi:MAG: beta-lactamase family protein [Oscillospiraceae bacterium]|nr:beta-lactamase family protein [Oscillospiraceae bacterium]